jgi:hypothetical protein
LGRAKSGAVEHSANADQPIGCDLVIEAGLSASKQSEAINGADGLVEEVIRPLIARPNATDVQPDARRSRS